MLHHSPLRRQRNGVFQHHLCFNLKLFLVCGSPGSLHAVHILNPFAFMSRGGAHRDGFHPMPWQLAPIVRAASTIFPSTPKTLFKTPKTLETQFTRSITVFGQQPCPQMFLTHRSIHPTNRPTCQSTRSCFNSHTRLCMFYLCLFLFPLTASLPLKLCRRQLFHLSTLHCPTSRLRATHTWLG